MMETRIDTLGYELLMLPRRNRCAIKWHTVVAEKALGKQLPKGAIVHHANEIRHDNSPANLVLCPNQAYHKLLHQRMRAKKMCGNANWLKCCYCKKYDDPKKMSFRAKGHQAYHSICINKYHRDYKAKNYEKMRAYHLKYQEENKTHIQELGREYWERNKKRINGKRRKK